ncbi:hypothetical protein LX77_00044 [Gelidibacter algens]|jgi:hypothetical protein|uniref:Lipoprotein n=1 Tax=Gelidibacter algens TaxID=49280 RepID=A0A1A7QW71_9FLAO|nr:DUF6146 family protein [Gelidibacter algens]OBX23791.1 hypothetical protein A9996_15645 [Gelidibacter algens]RAJ27472.1 hypothetical protein LX77_00044 [Gelidibacter algens]
MKTFVTLILLGVFIVSCKSTKSLTGVASNNTTTAQDTVRIANDSLEYEILIIEPGFNAWLASTAKPEGFYSQQYMETRNRQYVLEYNQRVLQPQRYSISLYEQQIDYQPTIDYGYEVNYKLYNYFIYFQLTYNQRLGPFTPRI